MILDYIYFVLFSVFFWISDALSDMVYLQNSDADILLRHPDLSFLLVIKLFIYLASILHFPSLSSSQFPLPSPPLTSTRFPKLQLMIASTSVSSVVGWSLSDHSYVTFLLSLINRCFRNTLAIRVLFICKIDLLN